MTVSQLRRRLEQEKGRHAHIMAELANNEAVLASLRAEREEIEQGQVIAQQVAQVTQAQVTIWITDMVGPAIEAVYPDDEYRFHLEFVQRRGATEADIMLMDPAGNRIRPRDADGGGLLNVAAFALRVALWSLSKSTRPVFVLDEPFVFLHSREYHARVAELLKEVSDRLGVQIIMVTGEEESEEIIGRADRVFRVSKGKVN